MPPLFQSYNTISLAVHAQLDSVLRLWQRRLGPDLLAVYLHGSLSLGRFQEENGDLDLLVLTARKLPREERLSLARDLLGDAFRFVKENTMCKVLSYKGNVFGLECPNFMDLVVTDTEPGFAGNTATNVTKPAVLETGAEIKVPLFIDVGDKITIDTRTGEYLSRCKE